MRPHSIKTVREAAFKESARTFEGGQRWRIHRTRCRGRRLANIVSTPTASTATSVVRLHPRTSRPTRTKATRMFSSSPRTTTKRPSARRPWSHVRGKRSVTMVKNRRLWFSASFIGQDVRAKFAPADFTVSPAVHFLSPGTGERAISEKPRDEREECVSRLFCRSQQGNLHRHPPENAETLDAYALFHTTVSFLRSTRPWQGRCIQWVGSVDDWW